MECVYDARRCPCWGSSHCPERIEFLNDWMVKRMPRSTTESAGVSKNALAFLDMLSISEGTSTIHGSDDGYDVLVGGSLFNGYADHPRKLVWLPSLHISSSAAGRYQLLARYYDIYKTLLGLHDFSPISQDLIALQQIRERHALPMIDAGRFVLAVEKCSNIWASLPGARYGQHEQKWSMLQTAYLNAGGTLAGANT